MCNKEKLKGNNWRGDRLMRMARTLGSLALAKGDCVFI